MKFISNLKNILLAVLFLMLNTLYFGSENSFGENGTMDNVKIDFCSTSSYCNFTISTQLSVFPRRNERAKLQFV